MVGYCATHNRIKPLQPHGSAKTVSWWCPNCSRDYKKKCEQVEKLSISIKDRGSALGVVRS